MNAVKTASIVTSLALLALACTTTTTTTNPDPTATGKDAGTTAKDAGKSDTGAASSTSSSSGDPPATTCADTTTQQECGTCCAADHQAGAKIYQDTVQSCICEAANCETECADTFCATTPKNPDAACNTCFDAKQANCGEKLTTACGANQDCVAFNQCLTDSGCVDKK